MGRKNISCSQRHKHMLLFHLCLHFMLNSTPPPPPPPPPPSSLRCSNKSSVFKVKKALYVNFVMISYLMIINKLRVMDMVMVLNITFNNISDISFGSILLVEETARVSRENHRPAASH